MVISSILRAFTVDFPGPFDNKVTKFLPIRLFTLRPEHQESGITDMKIGVDLGGSKIEGLVLGPDGRELGRKRVTTPAGDYDGTIDSISELISGLTYDHKVPDGIPVGVGIPGAVSRKTGLVKNANSNCLIGRPFDQDLELRLGRAVKIANDADCFAVSEATDGAGADSRVVFGVILGTGVGGGLAIDARPWVGPNAITGEWGHNPLPWPLPPTDSLDGVDERPGRPCYCGKNGCIETFLSGRGLAADHQASNGGSPSASKVVEAASNGDENATATLNRYVHRLARALASVINIVDPDVIVLGGGLSNIDTLYDRVPGLWQDWVFSDHSDTPLLKNHHGDSSGVRGAAWLWP